MDAIKVENLSKEYSIGKKRVKYYSLRDSLASAITQPFKKISRGITGKKDDEHTIFKALDSISFSVPAGQVVGLIGRNGAGKSTLLKILSRITDPTSGQASLYGRVSSLLEVGTGFHPELTGRENVYLNGAVLGMRKPEIDRKFDEIVEFAEISKFLDTPVKHYSSGMYMRLAFSVAAHLEPEILLVDEVLAVGDAGFQQKCLGKINNVASQGRTVIFVSHQLELLAQMCQRCILLDHGKIIADGSSRSVIDKYSALVRQAAPVALHDRVDRQGLGRFRFTATWLEDMSGNRIQRAYGGQPVKIVATYELAPGEQLQNISISFAVLTIRNLIVMDLGTDATGTPDFEKTIPSVGRIECIIPRLTLNSGEFVYNVLAKSARSGGDLEDWVKQAGYFSVEPGDYYGNGHIPGPANLICLDHTWSIASLGSTLNK